MVPVNRIFAKRDPAGASVKGFRNGLKHMPNRTENTSARSASPSRNPTGRRPRGPEHFSSEATAAHFPGLPEGESHREIKDLLEQLGRRSGMSEPLIKHLILLLNWSRPQDWQPGAQPIVWLSVKETAHKLGISTSQVRRNEATLHEKGAIAWKDSPNHRRFGYRDATGTITEAWGVNLAPAAALLPELRRLAQDYDDDRARWKFLRTRISACRANILSAIATALKNRTLDEREARAWRNLVAEAEGHIKTGTPLSALERRLRELDHLDAALQAELASNPDTPAEPVDNPVSDNVDACQGTHPRRPPLDDTTNESGFEKTTVAGEADREGDGVAKPDPCDVLRGDGPDDIPIREFLAIIPPIVRLRLPYPQYGWPDIVEAAYGAAGELGISNHAWAEACGELGRERAAVAVTIVAAKAERGLVRKPGGYLVGMTRKNVAGALRLRNSIFGLRHEKHAGAGADATAGQGRRQ